MLPPACRLTSEGFLHGADYNPDQWLKSPEVIAQDFRLLELANMNSVTLGVFSWAQLEPEEGRFEFGWMDDIFSRAEKQGVKVILATPSGGKPNWLALGYPEVRRVTADGHREPQGGRHNHCLTSPVYREKVRGINSRLAARYGRHPALVLWHISNELNGYCHCPLCWEAFRSWLKARYQTIDALNDAWWSRFWSHTYTDWSQIQSLDPSVHGLELDWKRFMTHQCCSFIRNEVEAVRPHSPHIPATTNFMPFHASYNQWELAREVDVISWDNYPGWHHGTSPEFDETENALLTAISHDAFRSMKKGAPFLLMETTPGQVNWGHVSPVKRPGVHRLTGLLAVAHGADSVCYFQFRKGLGSSEKFHGAVIGHDGSKDTRVFREVAALGATLKSLSGLAGAPTAARAALLLDWENRWALEQAQTHQNANKNYLATQLDHYRPLWKRGVPLDVLDQEADLSGYDLVAAPMLYMVRGDLGGRLAAFVQNGGTLIGTYCSGVVNGTDLCFSETIPGPLREVLGLRVEETDALPDGVERRIEAIEGADHGLSGSYQGRHYFDILHLEGATPLAVYAEDFYAGTPAVTVHRFGKGRAYYVASRNDPRFLDDLLGFLARDLHLTPIPSGSLPEGVILRQRTNGPETFAFLMNFRARPATAELPDGQWTDAESGEAISGTRVDLAPFGSRIFKTGRACRHVPLIGKLAMP